ncbi:MAG: ornithine cyclodeaminase family protein [Chloroflexi bacterium]|nr:ornithine cyclodeaminase family protein [Chloroflexota bacterium]
MRAVKFLYLKQEDVIAAGGLDMARTIEGVEKVFSMLDKGECIEPDPPMIMFGGQAGRRITMHPAYIGGDVDVAGLKWTPSNPDNPIKLKLPRATGIVILTDPSTGHPLSIMDGMILSAMRTGAVTGVGAKYLARPDSEVIGLLGAGVISRTQLMALNEVLKNIKEVKVFDLNQERSKGYAADMGTKLGLNIRAVNSTKEAVEGSDVVVGATTVSLDQRYVEADWIKDGSLYSNISDNDPKFEVILRSDKIVIDGPRQFTIPVVMGEMYRQGLIRKEDIYATVGEIVNRKKPGRENNREKIFLSPLGLGVEDLINAYRVYKQAKEMDIGQWLELWREPYWT